MEVNSRVGTASILVVEDDLISQEMISHVLKRAGFLSIVASNGLEALKQIGDALPDLIVSDVMMPEMDGFELLKALRENPRTSYIPVILLTSRDSCEDIVGGMAMGADDYLPKPFDPDILIARVKAKIARPPVPVENLIIDRQTGFLSARNFQQEAEREIFRAARGGKNGALVYCEILEMGRLHERLGEQGEREIARQISDILQSLQHPLDVFGHDPSGRFMILSPEIDQVECQKLLKELSTQLSNHTFTAQNESIRLTPVIGFCMFDQEKSYGPISEKAQIAFEYACSQMDLYPKVYNEEALTKVEKIRHTQRTVKKSSGLSLIFQRFKTVIQFLISVVMYLVIPYFIYWGLDKIGADITQVVYTIIVVTLLLTAILIWIEGFLSLKIKNPPDNPDLKYPPASAIIAAYLPNEAYTIAETLKVFLKLDYPNNIQIILAYNTPNKLPVEQTLQKMAKQDKRLVLLKVEGSESKSQNVNAAIPHVTGEFVGIFDADHHPDKDAFIRAVEVAGFRR